MKYDIAAIHSNDPIFPDELREKDGVPIYPRIWAIGNLSILAQPLMGFFCSQRCTGDVILKIYDFARELRKAGVPIIGGFHTPMEKECLELLLRGKQPVVICPARSIMKMRVSKDWATAISDGRLLILSPFSEKHNRITEKLAKERNQLVALLASEFLIYASPNSKTETIYLDLEKSGKVLKKIAE